MLTESQREHLRLLLKRLFTDTSTEIVPFRVPDDQLQRLRHLPDGYCKDLNLSPKYAKEFPCSTRELVQNWVDQCKELSRTHRVILHPSSVPGAAAVQIQAVHILVEDLNRVDDPDAGAPSSSSSPRPYVLGCAVEYTRDDGWRCLDLVNYATVMNPDMFSLGASEKQGKAYTAGHFGEGMKVQINRLVTEWNAPITISTGPCCWQFFHMNGPQCKQPTLHMLGSQQSSHGYPQAAVKGQETVVTVAGLPPRQPGIECNRYLFLQPCLSTAAVPVAGVPASVAAYLQAQPVLKSMKQWYEKVVVKGSSFTVEFLFAPHLHNHLYLHDIYLKPLSNKSRWATNNESTSHRLMSFGLNYHGSTEVLAQMGMNRDRTTVEVGDLLSTLLPEAISQLAKQRPGPQLECIVRHVYDALEREAGGTEQLTHASPRRRNGTQEFETMANLLCQLLWAASGTTREAVPNLFPCDGHQEIMAELELLGHKATKVSKYLLETWTHAGLLKNLRQLWEERRQHVDAMPDQLATLGGPEQQQQTEYLLSTLATVLAPLGPHVGLAPTAQALRNSMKVLGLLNSSCQHNKVVIPFKPNPQAGQGMLLVVEAEYLKSLRAVHRRMQGRGESCPLGGNCNGMCITQLLLEEALDGLRTLGVSQRHIMKCMTTQCMQFAAPKVGMLGRQEPVAVPLAPVAAATHRPDRVHNGGCDSGAAPAGVAPGPPGNGISHIPPAAPHGTASQGASPTQPRPDPRVGDGLIPCDDDQRVPAAWWRSAAFLQPPPTHLAPQPPQQAELAEPNCCCEHGLLASNMVLAHAATASSRAPVLYIPAGLTGSNEIAEAGRALFRVLTGLFDHVFTHTGPRGAGSSNNSNQATPHQLQFLIFYDPTSRAIAFNRNGQLWFNAAVRLDLSRVANPQYAGLRFWFLSICHELAHNQVKPHNSAFADACAGIVLEFTSRFRAYVAMCCGGVYGL